MHVTLNIHPADGVRAFEDVYEDMAKAMGVDYENEEPVNFDAADPNYLEASFHYIFHPMEDKGVDFWWLDWQQGGVTKVEGLDPLWVLNHYHYLDNARGGKRPMTFSRYADRKSQIPGGIFRRYGDHLGISGFSALLYLHCVQYRIRHVEP